MFVVSEFCSTVQRDEGHDIHNSNSVSCFAWLRNVVPLRKEYEV